MEQKINEENIENNLVFCIDPRKAFAIKSIQRSVFRNQLHQIKIRLFSILVEFLFRFLYKTMTKGTEYLNNITRKSVFRPLSPARWHDKHTYLSTFGKPRVMRTIESLGCNWWKNMHQIDAYCHNFFGIHLSRLVLKHNSLKTFV